MTLVVQQNVRSAPERPRAPEPRPAAAPEQPFKDINMPKPPEMALGSGPSQDAAPFAEPAPSPSQNQGALGDIVNGLGKLLDGLFGGGARSPAFGAAFGGAMGMVLPMLFGGGMSGMGLFLGAAVGLLLFGSFLSKGNRQHTE